MLGHRPEVSKEALAVLCTAKVWQCIVWEETPLGGALCLPFNFEAPHEC